MVAFAGLPDLGNASSSGLNNLHSSSGSGNPVKAKTRLGALGPVAAWGNWWGQATPPVMTNVDTSSPLSNPSTYSQPGIEVVRVPEVLELRLRPNPFRAGGGVIHLALPPEEGAFRVDVYDVQGRRRLRVAEGDAGAGGLVGEVAWAGQDDSGRMLPMGIYFLRIQTDRTTQVVKIVRVP